DGKEGKEGKEKKGKKGEAAKAEEEAEAADVSDFYHAAAGDSHIFCRKVDKKREKAALPEHRAKLKDQLKDLASSDGLLICCLGLQLALNSEGISGLQCPPELWALRLVSAGLSDESVREDTRALCDLCEKEGEAVSREAAVASWKERWMGSSKATS
ncbi:unnamed protein product, partial [Polarella glacialis]